MTDLLIYPTVRNCRSLPGLVPAEDNKEAFSRAETETLRKTIVDAMVDFYDQELRPRFSGISQEPGFVLAKATNEISVKWLEKHKDEIGRTCQLPFLILTGVRASGH